MTKLGWFHAEGVKPLPYKNPFIASRELGMPVPIQSETVTGGAKLRIG